MKRIGAEVRDQYYDEIEQLMARCGAATQKEFLMAAIALLRWAVEERAQGRVVGSLDDRRHQFREYHDRLVSNVRLTAAGAK